jgi:SAM-dependent methyltransferase
MKQPTIRFDDAAAYERFMGVWSQLAGEVFLDWLAPLPGQSWLDVGCGNGAFTELLMRRCAPSGVQGVDPSDAQIDYARRRRGSRGATFQVGDAMVLPFEGRIFDAAVMALVIFFVPDPAKGVAEMARVVRPGGLVSAYAWDILGGGFPAEPMQAELRAMGFTPPRPPSAEAAEIATLGRLWTEGGMERVETREIVVDRTYTDFDDFWGASTAMGTLAPVLDPMSPADLAAFKERVRARLPAADAAGRISYPSRAHAVKGRVAG